MKLSSGPFRWFSLTVVLLMASATVLLVAESFSSRPRPEAKPGPEPKTAVLPPAPIPVASGVASPSPAPGPRLPQAWMIAIGIDQYQDDAIPACRGAVRDARAVGRWFAKTAGWNDDHLLLLDDLGQADPGLAADPPGGLLPTRANLAWAFRTWLEGRVHPEDTIVVFYAGQATQLGKSEESEDGADAGAGTTYLLPLDARVGQIEQTGWRIDEAIDRWAASGKNPVVCWLDTSPRGRGRPVAVAAGAGGMPRDTSSLLPSLVRWPGVTAWLAAQDQPAAEAPAANRLSPFTEALLASLGTPERPASVLGCLGRLNSHPALAAQGFRTLGGIDPNLSLWSSRTRRQGLARRELVLQRGHAAAISALALTADGARLYTGAQDSTIKTWRLSDRSVLRADASHMVGVTSLDLSPDGRWLASGDGAGRVKLRDIVRDVELPPGPLHERGVDRVAFVGEGAHLVTLDLNGDCWFWKSAGPPSDTPLATGITGMAAARGDGAAAFALARSNGEISLYNARGEFQRTLNGPGGSVTSPRLATDGRLVAAASQDRVFLWDAASGDLLHPFKTAAAVETLALGPRGNFAVAAGPEVTVMTLAKHPAQPRGRVALPDPANVLAFSNDGRWLAVGTASGRLCLGRLTDGGSVEPAELEGAEAGGRTVSVALTPGGRMLISGDQDGGMRFWDLPDGRQRPPVLPRRGQVAALSASGDGRYLLQISQDWQAQIWDLAVGRGLTPVPGRWTSGALAPDGTSLYLTSAAEGDVAVLDRVTGQARPVRFARPPALQGPGAVTQRFARLTVSGDGRWIAAASTEGPLACVWDAATGRLLHTLRGHREPHAITALAFSADARRIVTASEDGTARLWDLSDPAAAPRASSEFGLEAPANSEPVPLSAAALTIGPEGTPRVATGALDGRIVLWDGVEKTRRSLELGRMDYAVLALAFTPDGHWVVASGADKTVWAWELDPSPRRVRLEPFPHHAEQVNALLAWPGSKLIVSGSDDTTIRFWNLETRSLLGTLSAEQGTSDWVAYTPDGLFDSSIGGERQVAWRDDQGLLTLDQMDETCHVYRLTGQLSQGTVPLPAERPRGQPPRLAVEVSGERNAKDRTAALLIALSETGLVNLRLYQNGVPVRADPEFGRLPGQQRVRTEIRLRTGVNRFHAMAGRPNPPEVEGRSEVVEVVCQGTEPAGRLHVLALGVSAYQPAARALGYAHLDARALAGFLHRSGLPGAAPGLEIVLTDDQVTEDAVDDAFVRIREQVREHPEDTVVAFLAGHADLLNGRFALLLPSFRFRDPGAGRAASPSGVDPDTILPYLSVYRNLARLGALQRLVVIDACQAEAIADDPGVHQIERLVDATARRSRTAYLLAARRGEPAGESSRLEHGLLTYALLKGLGDSTLAPLPPASEAAVEELPNADRDRDGLVTTEELRCFVAASIPALAARAPGLVMRTGADGRPTPPGNDADAGPQPRLQAAETSFSLIALPGAAGGRAGPAP